MTRVGSATRRRRRGRTAGDDATALGASTPGGRLHVGVPDLGRFPLDD
ncbi:hypothetical protein ACWFR1_39715 [Streptomyces sp. NPDC055103]